MCSMRVPDSHCRYAFYWKGANRRTFKSRHLQLMTATVAAAAVAASTIFRENDICMSNAGIDLKEIKCRYCGLKMIYEENYNGIRNIV